MKLDNMEKRLGLLMLLAGIALLLIMYLVWLIVDFRGVYVLDSLGLPAYRSRGYMDTLLHEWLGISMVAFPLLLCGVILLLGYGKGIFHWVRYGKSSGKGNEDK